MAFIIPITVTCSSCNGEGSRIIGYDEQQNPIYENPCTGCGGDGKTTTALIDATFADDIYDKCNDILNKCNDILTEVQGG